MDGTKIVSNTDNYDDQHFEHVHNNDNKENINKLSGVNNQVSVAPPVAAPAPIAPAPKKAVVPKAAAPKAAVVYSGVGLNADREDRL